MGRLATGTFVKTGLIIVIVLLIILIEVLMINWEKSTQDIEKSSKMMSATGLIASTENEPFDIYIILIQTSIIVLFVVIIFNVFSFIRSKKYPSLNSSLNLIFISFAVIISLWSLKYSYQSAKSSYKISVRQEIREESLQHISMIRENYVDLQNFISSCLTKKNYTSEQKNFINSSLDVIENDKDHLQDLFFNEKFDEIINYSTITNKKIKDLKEYLNCSRYPYGTKPLGIVPMFSFTPMFPVIIVLIIITMLLVYFFITKRSP